MTIWQSADSEGCAAYIIIIYNVQLSRDGDELISRLSNTSIVQSGIKLKKKCIYFGILLTFKYVILVRLLIKRNPIE